MEIRRKLEAAQRPVERKALCKYFLFKKISLQIWLILQLRDFREFRACSHWCVCCYHLFHWFEAGCYRSFRVVPRGHYCKSLYASVYVWSPKHFCTYTYVFSLPPPHPDRSTSLSEVEAVDVYVTQENVGLSVCPFWYSTRGTFSPLMSTRCVRDRARCLDNV
jgi:hypothetical protein